MLIKLDNHVFYSHEIFHFSIIEDGEGLEIYVIRNGHMHRLVTISSEERVKELFNELWSKLEHVENININLNDLKESATLNDFYTTDDISNNRPQMQTGLDLEYIRKLKGEI